MDQPKLERLLHLMMLLTANTRYTVDELAERMETSPRSIYRYLDTFKAAGFAIYEWVKNHPSLKIFPNSFTSVRKRHT